MTRIQDQDNLLLLQKLSNYGRTNLSERVKNIVEDFCEDQAIKEHTLFDDVKH